MDTHIYCGYTIPSFYDSLVAKLIVLAPDRNEAIARMSRVLQELIIDGIKTTKPLHQKIMSNDYFKTGKVYTDFLNKYIYGIE